MYNAELVREELAKRGIYTKEQFMPKQYVSAFLKFPSFFLQTVILTFYRGFFWLRFFLQKIQLLMKVKRADTAAQSDFKKEEKYAQIEEISAMAKKIEEEKECFSLSSLAINGTDLKDFLSGRQIGKALRECLDGVIEGTLPNEKNALLDFARKTDFGEK